MNPPSCCKCQYSDMFCREYILKQVGIASIEAFRSVDIAGPFVSSLFHRDIVDIIIANMIRAKLGPLFLRSL